MSGMYIRRECFRHWTANIRCIGLHTNATTPFTVFLLLLQSWDSVPFANMHQYINLLMLTCHSCMAYSSGKKVPFIYVSITCVYQLTVPDVYQLIVDVFHFIFWHYSVCHTLSMHVRRAVGISVAF